MQITIFTLRTTEKWSRELRNVVQAKLFGHSGKSVIMNLQNTKAKWIFFPARQ